MKFIKPILTLLLLTLVKVGFTQGNSYKHYTIREGLPSNTIRSIYKDSRGYLWIGSDAGVSRFDGNNFVTFNSKNGLVGEYVWSIQEDGQGRIWFGCYNDGISIYDGRTFSNISIEDSLHNVHIRNLTFCAQPKTMLAGCQDGVVRFNMDGSFSEFNRNTENVKSPILVGGIYEFDKDSAFVATMSAVTWIYIISEDKLIQAPENHKYYNQRAHCLMTKDDELVLCSGSVRKFGKDSIIEWYFKDFGLFGPAWDIASDNHGNIWAATWGGGSTHPFGHLIRFDENGVGEDYALKLGIKSEVFWSLYYDKENDLLFIGTLDQGLFVMPFSPFEQIDVLSDYRENEVSLAFGPSNEKILVGQQDLFLLENDQIQTNLFDPSILQMAAFSFAKRQYELNMVSADPDGSFEKYDQLTQQKKLNIKNPYLDFLNNELPAGSLYKSNVKHVAWEISKKDWIDQWKEMVYRDLNVHSLFVIDDQTYLSTTYGLVKLVEDGNHEFYNLFTGPTFVDRAERLWTFPHYSHTCLIEDINKPYLQKQFDYRKMIAPTSVSDACDGPENQVLISSVFNGFFVYKGENKFVQYSPANSFFTSERILTVDNLKDDLYISAQGNGDLIFFEANTDTLSPIKIINTQNGLHGRAIFDVLFKNDNLYIWHENGVDKAPLNEILESDDINFALFDEKEGYPIYTGEVHDLGDEVWLVHNKGYVKINWEQFESYDRTQTTLQISNFKIDYEDVEWDESQLDNNWQFVPEQIELNYHQNNIEVYFDVINLNNYGKDEFRFLLKGLDDSWTPWRKQHRATYAGLSPGEYVFNVESRNNLNPNNIQRKSIEIIVYPPWWETTWFRLLMIAFLVSSLVMFFRLRTRKLRRRQKELEEKIDEATEEIRHQKNEIEEAHTEIKDSINYAQRIQNAILPTDKKFYGNLPNSFVLYKPKDVVAGDFYWMEKIGQEVLFAAADCTGHGVPGAMVSVVCNNALNRTIREYKETDPGKILDRTREIIVEEFSKSNEQVKDGMDVSLCALKGNVLSFAGAHNPLWIIKKDAEDIIEVKADKQPVGKFDMSTPFTTHRIEMEKGDTFYIFSDGFSDQFGGDKGKKFKAANFKKLLLSIQSQSMSEQKKTIDEAFEKWRGDLEQLDDVCVIGVQV